jgi:hypothetical protein
VTRAGDERRRGLRVPVDFFVLVRLPGDRIALYPATDISTSGIYLLASDDPGAIDAESALDLEFTLPSGAVVRTFAQVAYIDDRMGQLGLGALFAELDPEQHTAIDRFVAASNAALSRLG